MDERARIDAVLRAVAQVRRREAGPLSQGLSAQNARRCLNLACDALTREGLEAELATPGDRPSLVAVIVAAGVFTSPLEWVAMLAAAGCRAALKAPSAWPALCDALVEDFGAENLPVSRLPDRRIPEEAEAVIAFGSDETMEALAAAGSDRRLALYGHRFSAAIVDTNTQELQALARNLALDHALYDTRGCMAPVAIFAMGDADALTLALAEAMAEAQAQLPRGDLDPGSGPLLRERLGLARARGRARVGAGWAVLALPAAYFQPVALTRTVVIHAVTSLEEAAAILAPWRAHLSSCATNLGREALAPLGFPRLCAPGTLQTPPFPRRHDGVPMLGSVLRA